MHCFLKWLKQSIGGLNTGADPQKFVGVSYTFVNSQVIYNSCFLGMFSGVAKN